MMSSVFVPKLVSLPIFVVVVAMQTFFTYNVLSLNLNNALNQTNAYLHHQCNKSQGTYDSGSQYEKDIKEMISAGSQILDTSGFVESSSSTIFTKFQCRGDLSISECRSCFATAFSGVRKRCPKNKGRTIWYDYCVLDISSVYRWPEIDYQNIFYLYNTKDVSGGKELFNKKTRALLHKLKDKSLEEKNSLRKTYLFAAGEESIGTTKVYAMVACMKDVTRKNCSVCLDRILEKFPKCCNGKIGGRVLCTFCNFRFELYPFVKPLV